MAGSLSTALHNKLLDHVFKTTPFPVPDNIYVALYSAAPNEAGGGTELTGNGYARTVHNSWDTGAGGHTENTGVIVCPDAVGGNWLEAVAFGLFDAITGGTFLGWGLLAVPQTVNENGHAEFADGALDATMTPAA